ncbi:MAG: hypothetical protein ABR518_08385 [Actinomycetota bacterium]
MAAVAFLLGGAALLWAGAALIRLDSAPAGAATVLPGLSIEGLAVVAVASAVADTSTAAGVAFGVALVFLALGFGTALLVPRARSFRTSSGSVLLPAAALIAAAFAVADQEISRLEGLGLLVVYAAYAVLADTDATAGGEGSAPTNEPRPRPDTAFRPNRIIAGAALGLAGAWAVVAGGDGVLDRSTLLAGFVGAAMMAPAAIARLVVRGALAARSTPTDGADPLEAMACFCTAAPGAAAVVRPLLVDAAASYAFLAVTVIYALVAAVMLATGRTWRPVGVAVLGLYGLWLALASSA